MDNITARQAYEWVKAGHWSNDEFIDWVTKQTGASWSEGYEEGWLAGHNVGYESGRDN